MIATLCLLASLVILGVSWWMRHEAGRLLGDTEALAKEARAMVAHVRAINDPWHE